MGKNWPKNSKWPTARNAQKWRKNGIWGRFSSARFPFYTRRLDSQGIPLIVPGFLCTIRNEILSCMILGGVNVFLNQVTHYCLMVSSCELIRGQVMQCHFPLLLRMLCCQASFTWPNLARINLSVPGNNHVVQVCEK